MFFISSDVKPNLLIVFFTIGKSVKLNSCSKKSLGTPASFKALTGLDLFFCIRFCAFARDDCAFRLCASFIPILFSIIGSIIFNMFIIFNTP